MESFELMSIWISVLMAVVAISSVIVSYTVLRSSTDPEVIVFAQPDKRRPTIINLVIKNIGKSSALNVTFSSSRPLPMRAFGFENAPMPEKMTDGPLITGIPYIAPDQEFILTWGQYGGLIKYFSETTIDITSDFERSTALVLPSMKRKKTTSRLDIKSWEQTDSSDHNWDKQTAEELKKINQNLTQLNNSIKKWNAVNEGK